MTANAEKRKRPPTAAMQYERAEVESGIYPYVARFM